MAQHQVSDAMNYAAYILDRLDQPFRWGTNDCVTFAVGWLSMRAGVSWLDAAPNPDWETPRQAAIAIKKVGGLEKAFNQNLKAINPNYAQDGDITIVGKCAMLFTGRHLVGPGQDGLVFIDRTKAKCAWSL